MEEGKGAGIKTFDSHCRRQKTVGGMYRTEMGAGLLLRISESHEAQDASGDGGSSFADDLQRLF